MWVKFKESTRIMILHYTISLDSNEQKHTSALPTYLLI